VSLGHVLTATVSSAAKSKPPVVDTPPKSTLKKKKKKKGGDKELAVNGAWCLFVGAWVAVDAVGVPFRGGCKLLRWWESHCCRGG
jgi:hypothetical protein